MSAMTIVSREARTVWDGDLVHGSGNVSGMSGALDTLPVTFKSRLGSPDGRTSPEELIARGAFVVFLDGACQSADAGRSPARSSGRHR
ncbi:MAG: lipoyl-dependent peroxiredoxin [Mycobacterium sp.]|nr:lipoyl-dependent peroxiredoxin [Mycobacterium sp.]